MMWRGILNIPLEEFLLMTPGEFNDMVAAYQIAKGYAEPGENDEDGSRIIYEVTDGC